ncbi:MAG: hypothetical protein NW224_04275 [Leptolyngbyaceae cyanobacterium bins.302]|nr:hypothetical protein [Leptolyngbyaceae cyanobacterium bins.302]
MLLLLLSLFLWEFYIHTLINSVGCYMSSVGLNKWIVSGHLAADAEIKTVDLRSGEKAKVAKATIYVRKQRNREESFTVSLSIWEGAPAWRKLSFLKKGSLIICTGSVEPNPYVSNSDNLPRAGLSMNVLDIDLDNIRSSEEEDELSNGSGEVAVADEVAGETSGDKTAIAASEESEKPKPPQAVAPVKESEPSNGAKQAKQEAKVPAKA